MLSWKEITRYDASVWPASSCQTKQVRLSSPIKSTPSLSVSVVSIWSWMELLPRMPPSSSWKGRDKKEQSLVHGISPVHHITWWPRRRSSTIPRLFVGCSSRHCLAHQVIGNDFGFWQDLVKSYSCKGRSPCRQVLLWMDPFSKSDTYVFLGSRDTHFLWHRASKSWQSSKRLWTGSTPKTVRVHTVSAAAHEFRESRPYIFVNEDDWMRIIE